MEYSGDIRKSAYYIKSVPVGFPVVYRDREVPFFRDLHLCFKPLLLDILRRVPVPIVIKPYFTDGNGFGMIEQALEFFH